MAEGGVCGWRAAAPPLALIGERGPIPACFVHLASRLAYLALVAASSTGRAPGGDAGPAVVVLDSVVLATPGGRESSSSAWATGRCGAKCRSRCLSTQTSSGWYGATP